jgi:uncharacterized protein YaaR (DUF327 family)
MSDKRMLIVPAELVKKIDENRGDLSQADFIDLLIESKFREDNSGGGVDKHELDALRQEIKDLTMREKKMATKEELAAFHDDTKKLLKSFVDFFVGYGLELGEKTSSLDLRELTGKLDALKLDSQPEDGGREVKIKWK